MTKKTKLIEGGTLFIENHMQEFIWESDKFIGTERMFMPKSEIRRKCKNRISKKSSDSHPKKVPPTVILNSLIWKGENLKRRNKNHIEKIIFTQLPDIDIEYEPKKNWMAWKLNIKEKEYYLKGILLGWICYRLELTPFDLDFFVENDHYVFMYKENTFVGCVCIYQEN